MHDERFCTALSKHLGAKRPTIDNETDFLQAAVLLPLLHVNGELHILFEVRSSQLTWQPGEICFPGGKIDAADVTPLTAAIRETAEELALCPKSIRILGALDYLVSPIGVMLFPFAGYLKDISAMRPNHGEVAEVFTVPLNYLLQAQPVVGHMEMATRPLADFPVELLNYPQDWKRRTTYPVWFYQYQGYVIWGLTARVLYSFLNVCRTIADK